MKISKIDFKFLDLDKILSLQIWVLKNRDKSEFNNIGKKIIILIRLFLSLIYRSFFFIPKIKLSKQNFEVFYIRTFIRPDLERHSSVYENIDQTSACVLMNKKIKIDIITFFKSCKVFLNLREKFIEVLKKNKINFFSIDGMMVFLRLLFHFNECLKILPIVLKHKKVVSFQEMTPVENMVCQIANNFNIKTFGLEHALGIYKDQGFYWERYAITTYRNTVCQNILCWGKVSKSVFAKHTKAKIYIIGKSILPEITKVDKGIAFIFQNKICTLANEKLLSLSYKLEHLNFPISRWFKRKRNSLLKSGVARDGPLREIIIGYSSNLLLELGFLGFKVFVLQGSILAKWLPENLLVNDNNIELTIEQILKKESYPNLIWRDFIECTGAESTKRYKEIVFNYN